MNISILGCGWVGLPLAKNFLNSGHSVKGSTTSLEKMNRLQVEGIVPYQIKIFEEGVQGDLSAFLADAELLVVDIPPGLRSDPEVDFVKKIRVLKDHVEKSPVKKVLFISSTSVYEDGKEFPFYTEDNDPNGTAENSVQLAAAEALLKSSKSFSLTVIRFGGLFGPGRHPVNFLAGRTAVKNPKAPVNLIHLEDCIGIIEAVVEQGVWEETFNAVHPDHPSKEEYYTRKAKIENLNLPKYDATISSKGKVVASEKVEKILNYSFRKGL